MQHLNVTQDDLIPVFKKKTRGAVGHYFTGRRQPSPDQIIALAERLNDALQALRDRMEYFEECVQCACDPDDCPPAR